MIYERDTIVNQPDGTCHGVVTGGSDQLSRVGAPFLRNVYTYVIPYLATHYNILIMNLLF